jgi:hypothetical protein
VKKLLLVLLVMVLRVVLLIPASLAETNLSGTWTVTETGFDGHLSAVTCALRQQDRHLSVRCGTGVIEWIGAVDHRRAEWHWQYGIGLVTFTAVVAESGKKMRGTWRVHFDDDGSEQNAPFSAVKTHD